VEYSLWIKGKRERERQREMKKVERNKERREQMTQANSKER
jgi:hypothetical protein